MRIKSSFSTTACISKLAFAGITFCISIVLNFQILHSQVVERERPVKWNELVPGGQFKDLFKPMPVLAPLTKETWGGSNVLPRDVTNGIEDSKFSYWGGNAILGDDGKYHLYVCRWPEGGPRGHFEFSDSTVVHAVADNSLGPYTVKDSIGTGHNPTIYETTLKNGKSKYVIYYIGGYYHSESLDGPWKRSAFDFFKRERWSVQRRVNFTFAQRDDGSHLAVSRRGYVWASQDGLKEWHQVTQDSVFPKVEGIFEDPVVWKDNVQFHLIANDWKGRIAYYMRSKDGIHWKTEPGEAYSTGMARYTDGTAPQWYKYERIRMLQDNHGRATQAHFAVIDSDKFSDKASDIHSSKHICIPLTVGRLATVLNAEAIGSTTSEIRLKVVAEPGFNPHLDLDFDSLRFGASEEVNFGRGSRVLKTEQDGSDLIVTFEGKGSGIDKDNFAGKLLGKSNNGELTFAWARLPATEFKVPVLSSLSPKFEWTEEGLEAYVEVQNFGEIASTRSKLSVVFVTQLEETLIANGSIRPLKPFEKTIVRMVCKEPLPNSVLPKGKQKAIVHIDSDGLSRESFSVELAIPLRK